MDTAQQIISLMKSSSSMASSLKIVEDFFYMDNFFCSGNNVFLVRFLDQNQNNAIKL